MGKLSNRPWPDRTLEATNGRYHGEPAGRCGRCGAELSWRVGEETLRGYKVETANRQFHKPRCPVAKLEKAPEPVSIGTIQETITTLPQEARDELIPFRPMHESVPELRRPKEAQDGLAALIASIVAPLLPKPEATIDEQAVRRIVAAELAADGSRSIEVRFKGSTDAPVKVGRQHRQFETLLKVVSLRLNAYLCGPAGTSKTTTAHAVADALKLQFGSVSVCRQMPASHLFGYRDSAGNYHDTIFRRCYEFGGVFLFDEFDHGDANTLGAINQAIENGSCAFPDGMIDRHPDFVCIVAANTIGKGASRDYVGANQMDAATLDRFVFIAWDIDEDLEWDIASSTYHAFGGTDSQTIAAWIGRVRLARTKAVEHKVRHVVSPRASYMGAKLLAAGLPVSQVADMVLWKGLDADAKARLS
jgi:cobaltochelatase CobS